MHRSLIVMLALVFTAVPAVAQVAQRDRPTARFESDIRANNEAMSRRFSGASHKIDAQNIRMRERLHSSKGSSLRR